MSRSVVVIALSAADLRLILVVSCLLTPPFCVCVLKEGSCCVLKVSCKVTYLAMHLNTPPLLKIMTYISSFQNELESGIKEDSYMS